MEDEYDSQGGVVWNFDDEESKLIFEMKLMFIKERDAWNLEGAYWALWRLLSEIEPLFDDSVQKELNEDFEKLTVLRNQTNNFSIVDENEKGIIAEQLNNFYRKICREAVEKNYYFRKKKEYVGL